MNSNPQSEPEWTVHAINIHGVFFERWCQNVIANTGDWRVVSTNYPVSFPPANGPLIGKESALDIRAELRTHSNVLTLLVECKKANPDFVNWIFFPKRNVMQHWLLNARLIVNQQQPPPAINWTVMTHYGGPVVSAMLADEARETRGSYEQYPPSRRDKTRTSNAAITDAAYQIGLATQAIFAQEAAHNTALSSRVVLPPTLSPMPYTKNLIVSMIVTSARLYTCAFDPGAVDARTGEIPYDKAPINEVSYLFYDYPLPSHLQAQPSNLADVANAASLETYVRLPILVVQSEALSTVLTSVLPSFLHAL